MLPIRYESKEEKPHKPAHDIVFNWKSIPTFESTWVRSIFGEFFSFYSQDGIQMSKEMIKLGDMASKHPSGMAHYWVANIHAVILTNTDLITQLFGKHKKYLSRTKFLEANFAVAFGDHNQFTVPVRHKDGTPNKLWRQQRQAITNAIHQNKLARDFSWPMSSLVCEVLDGVDSQLKESKQELTINLESLCMKVTMLVAAKLLLGVPMEDKNFVELTDYFAALYTDALNESLKFKNEIKYRLKFLRCGRKSETEKRRENLIEAIKTYFITPYKENILATDNVVRKIAKLDPKNIDKIYYEDFTLDTDYIKDAVAFLLLVGHDTTSRAIQFMIMNLSEDEELLTQVLDEIKKFEPKDGVWTPGVVKEMPILNAIFKEVERLYPGAPILGYTALKDITLDAKDLGQFELKQNSVVMASIWNVQRSEKYFENPNKFDHTRFLKKEFSLKPNSKTPEFLPFGIGERPCVAYEFGPYEAIVFVIEFVQRYQFGFKQRPSFQAEMLGTLRHEGPANLTVRLRGSDIPKSEAGLSL